VRLFTAESAKFSFGTEDQSDARYYRAIGNHLEHSCDEGSGRYNDSRELNRNQEEVVDGTYQTATTGELEIEALRSLIFENTKSISALYMRELLR
jgi:hypothetical protein